MPRFGRFPRWLALPELWILTAVAAVLRFWALFTPNAVVFDELYYERFAGYYLDGIHFFARERREEVRLLG